MIRPSAFRIGGTDQIVLPVVWEWDAKGEVWSATYSGLTFVALADGQVIRIHDVSPDVQSGGDYLYAAD